MKVAIAEDHSLYLDGLKLVVKELDPKAHIISAQNFDDAMLMLHQHSDIDLLLLDIQMPGTKSLDGVKQIREEFPFLPIVVISMLDMGFNVDHVMKLGANGFVTKASSKQQLLEALNKVLAGEIVVVSNASHSNLNFTPRQISTLQLLVEGLSNKEIAVKLSISPATVREYVSDILHKLGVDNRVKAAIVAKERGIIID